MGTLFYSTETGYAPAADAVESKPKRHRRTKEQVNASRKEEAARLLGIENDEEEQFDEKSVNPTHLLKKLMQVQTFCLSMVKDSSSVSNDGKSFRFVSGSRVLGTIRPMMDRLGLLLLPVIRKVSHDVLDVQQPDSRGQMNWTKQVLYTLDVNFVWTDSESGETLEVPFVGAGCNGLDQGIGSALTYAERYFLLKFFHIPTDEDDIDALRRSFEMMLSKPSPAVTEVPNVEVIDQPDSAGAPDRLSESNRQQRTILAEQPVEPQPETTTGPSTVTPSEPQAENTPAAAADEARAKTEPKPKRSSRKTVKSDETQATAQDAGQPVTDSRGRELGVNSLPEQSKLVLQPSTPYWYKVAMRLYGVASGLTKEQLRCEVEKDYIVTDEVFEQLYAEVTA